MPERYSPFCQVVRRQLNRHPIACKNLDVMLAHLAGQVSQHIVPIAYPHLERSITHALDYGSINGNHIFSWNGMASLDV